MRRGLFLCAPIVFVLVAPSCGSSSPGSGFDEPDAGEEGGVGNAGSCGAQKRTCGGVCVDVMSDPKNCSDCGRACDSGAQCCGGVCVTTAACSFAVTKVNNPRLYKSGGQWITVTGSGFAKGMRVNVGDGRAPARVIDDKTAIIQTPPGTGIVDLTIDVGGNKATLPHAFEYVEAGLQTPWQQKPMKVVRGENPGLAVLQDGRVLISGGTAVPDDPHALDTAEIYTRTTDIVTPVAGQMQALRWHDASVTLLTGKVLVTGAACAGGFASCPEGRLADLFDPTTNTYTPTKSPMNAVRHYTRAVLLPDGRVLVSSATDPTLEIYDPETDAFTLIPHTIAHDYGFMVRLRDGRVLLGGGDGGIVACEIFDPDTNTITPAASLREGRSMLTAHTLPDGRVLAIGGANQSAGGIHTPLDTIEAYDAKANQWTTMPYKLSIGRTWHASALVRDGTVLVMGGYTIDGRCNSLTDSVDQILPVANKTVPFANLPNPNTEWTAVTLLDGSVLAVGGGACGTASALPDIDFLPGTPDTK
jgi:IPT/TIG domain/Stigma-specific protein, Stig1/Kelch motif